MSVDNQVAIEGKDEFNRQEDKFERLWVPHRMVYIDSDDNRGKEGKDSCPFCVAPEKTDEEGLIVYRGKLAYVLLNLFPYNTAHLLVCPYRHVSLYEEATDAERIEIAELTSNALKVVRYVLNPDGFNLGMNQGEVAGAGIAAHLHQHIVPRWKGDANFFPIIGQTKALPTLLDDTRQQLAKGWSELAK
ncbi:MAG: HIT domain-containing protein [Candidatus Ancillula sp.]|jgi:ATP adenylyltransferase|nr:HIT domain-containing protein [Candidatus Ancillula sp.]